MGSREEGNFPVGGDAGRKEQGSGIRTQGTMLGEALGIRGQEPVGGGVLFPINLDSAPSELEYWLLVNYVTKVGPLFSRVSPHLCSHVADLDGLTILDLKQD